MHPSAAHTVRDYCEALLRRGDLAAKLTPAPAGLDDAPAGPLALMRPARDPGLAMGPGRGALPRPAALRDPGARARCLARFAHHEIQAVELFAWALLRWPRLPAGLRQDWLRALGEEQLHSRLYLERLAHHGAPLESFAPHSGYFWRHAPAMAAGGPEAFLAGMGLTYEQANLDFTRLYAEAFAAGGDAETARVLERVHADEIRHVRLAAVWLRALRPEGDDVARYRAAVPFPLSAARAKARRFDAAARREAGLEPAFVAYVQRARSSQERSRP